MTNRYRDDDDRPFLGPGGRRETIAEQMWDYVPFKGCVPGKPRCRPLDLDGGLDSDEGDVMLFELFNQGKFLNEGQKKFYRRLFGPGRKSLVLVESLGPNNFLETFYHVCRNGEIPEERPRDMIRVKSQEELNDAVAKSLRESMYRTLYGWSRKLESNR